MKSRRKGIALLWVVLTSVLVLVAILGISMKVVPQKKVENARAYTLRALAVAESGLADTTYKVRTDTALKLTLQSLSSGQSYDSHYVPYNSGVATTNPHDSTYRVIVKKTAAGYTFYSLGTVYSRSGTYASSSSTVEPTAAALARQAITVTYNGSFTVGEYALLTEGAIDVHNGTVNGSVFANTSVDVRANGAVLTGMAYCPGTFIGVPADQREPNVRTIDIPAIPLDSYRQEWTAFVNGTGHYATDTYPDTTSLYPDTSTASVKAFIQGYIHTLSGAAPQGEFDNFFSALQTSNDPGAVYLRKYLRDGILTFDIKPAPNDGQGVVDFGPLYSSTNPSLVLQGTIVIEGNLKLTGNAVIGVEPLKTALLVTGGVSITASGNTASQVNGLLYIEGTWGQVSGTPLSFDGGGGFQCNGSVVATDSLGLIQLRSSNVVVTFQKNAIYASQIQGSLEDQLSRVSPVPSSWRQISYDAFLDAATK